MATPSSCLLPYILLSCQRKPAGVDGIGVAIGSLVAADSLVAVGCGVFIVSLVAVGSLLVVGEIVVGRGDDFVGEMPAFDRLV